MYFLYMGMYNVIYNQFCREHDLISNLNSTDDAQSCILTYRDVHPIDNSSLIIIHYKEKRLVYP